MRDAGPRRVPRADRAAPGHPHLPAADADLHAARPSGAATTTNLDSLQCFWYGAAPMSAARLEEALTRIGPVMAQLFGQTEAPMMISMMAPGDHFNADGSVARERLASAGRPGAAGAGRDHGRRRRSAAAGERGEIVVRGSLVMAGYYKNPEATAEASAFGWHHTGDIGYLDDDGFLYIVDRAKDMIITGGFNVYSAEVEQALMAASGGAGLRGDRPARREVGRAGRRRRAAARRPQRRAPTSCRRSSRRGSAASRRRSRSRSGPTCRAPRSARC